MHSKSIFKDEKITVFEILSYREFTRSILPYYKKQADTK